METVLSVAAIGVRVEVDLAPLPEDEREQLRAAWSRAAWSRALPTHDPNAEAVRLPVESLRLGAGYPRTADNLSSQVTVAAIRANGGRLVMFHAAGLAEPATGRTLAFVGASGSGKTTLTRTLAEHWGYVSDETVAVHPTTLQVVPHPKPLSVKVAPVGPKEQYGPDQLGLLPAPAACRLAGVVLLDRDPDHLGGPEVTPYGLVRTVAELTRELSTLARWDRPLVTVAGLLAAVSGPVVLRYAEARDVVAVVEDLLTADGPDAWEALPLVSDARDAIPPGHWQRAPYRDAIADPTALAVLHSHGLKERVTLLEGLGPILWREAAAPRSEDELTERVLTEHGPPPGGDGRATVRAALDDLVSHGVLTAGS